MGFFINIYIQIPDPDPYLEFWIRQKVSDPCGSGSTTLLKSVNFILINKVETTFDIMFLCSKLCRFTGTGLSLKIFTVSDPLFSANLCTLSFKKIVSINSYQFRTKFSVHDIVLLIKSWM
jgi:hypothetical protein